MVYRSLVLKEKGHISYMQEKRLSKKDRNMIFHTANVDNFQFSTAVDNFQFSTAVSSSFFFFILILIVMPNM